MITGGGVYDMLEYRVYDDGKYENMTSSSQTSILRTESQTIICGMMYEPEKIDRIEINGKEVFYVDIRAFNSNIKFDLENVRVFHAVYNTIDDSEYEILAYDSEGNIIKALNR